MKDTVPVDPEAEPSLENVLSDIRFRCGNGYILSDYSISADRTTVVLEFAPVPAPGG